MSSGTRSVKQKNRKISQGSEIGIPIVNSLNLNANLKRPHGVASSSHELLNLGASSSQNLFQALITNQDLLRLRENHKTLRKGWWCRAFATAINRRCPTCNRLWTTEQFPPSLTQCLTCSRLGTKKKPSQFKLLDSQVGLIFRLALPVK